MPKAEVIDYSAARRRHFGWSEQPLPLNKTTRGMPAQVILSEDVSCHGTIDGSLLDTLDFTSGNDDKLILHLLTHKTITLEQQLDILNRMYYAIFPNSEAIVDENRAGYYLSYITNLFSNNAITEPLRERIDVLMSGALLESLVLQSTRERWSMENAQALLHAYCRLGSLEKLWGREQAAEFKHSCAQRLVYGRIFDTVLDKTTIPVAQQNRNTISLGVQGAEVAQIAAQRALVETTKELGVKGHIWPYYRERLLVMGEESEGFATPEQIAQDLFRVGDPPRGAGVELASLGGTFDTEGELIVFPGYANISGNLNAAEGAAMRFRQEGIEREHIVFDQPERTNAYRTVQLKSPVDVMVVGFGDGAWLNLNTALEFAGVSRAPVIFLCENNEVAIGVNATEVMADSRMWIKGHGVGVPGIRLASTDFDGMVLAMRFAALRAAGDGGATILEFMTKRTVAHSSHHGHHLVPELIVETRNILEKQLAAWEENDARRGIVELFMSKYIFAPTRFDRTIDVKKRVLDFLAEIQLDNIYRKELEEIMTEVIDPIDEVLSAWQAAGIVTAEELSAWRTQYNKEIKTLMTKVLQQPLPDPRAVDKHIRLPHPNIITSGRGGKKEEGVNLEVPLSKRELSLTGAEAQSLALLEAMQENPRLLFGGVDTYAGQEVKGGVLKHKGGYFHQADGVWESVAHLPGRFWNLPITENAFYQRFMGMVTQPTSKIAKDYAVQQALLRGELQPNDVNPQDLLYRVLLDGQYGDYMVHAIEGMWVHAGVLQNTHGKVCRPLGALFPCAMVDGGGGMHSHSVEGVLNTMPSGSELYTVSDVQTYYELLRYLLRFGNNPYSIVIDRAIYHQKASWQEGVGLWEPGRDRVVQQGGDLQIITWGPMRKVVESAVAQLTQEPAFAHLSIGIIDKISWKPFGTNDLAEFLKEGSGPVIVATEDIEERSLGNRIIMALAEKSSVLSPHVVGKNRPILHCASSNVSHPYCDARLMAGNRYEDGRLITAFKEILNAEKRK